MVVSQFFSSPLRTLKNKARGGTGSRQNHDCSSSDDDPLPSSHSRTAPLTTGTCLCCGSKVGYPPTVSCFKCTICDTINNLRPALRTEKALGEAAVAGVEGGQPASRVRVAPPPPPPPLTLDRLKAGVQAYRRHPEKQSLLEAMLRESFGCWDVLNFSFVVEGEIKVDEVHAAYKIILALPPVFIRAMMAGIEQILRRPGRPLVGSEDIRYLLIILENPLLLQQTFPQESSYHHHLVKSIVGSLANLPNKTHYALVLWLSHHSRSSIRRKVTLVNQFITYRVQKYDRARRRNREARAAPLTSYSAQSTQSELPAFQRTRSTTNAPLPLSRPGGGQQQGRQGQQRMRPGGHSRMRSNTDSRISLSSHERASVIQELEEMQQSRSRNEGEERDRNHDGHGRQGDGGHGLSPNNPFYAAVNGQQQPQQGQNGGASGLGIANLRIGDQQRHPPQQQQQPTRFASMGTVLHGRRTDWSPVPAQQEPAHVTASTADGQQFRAQRSRTTGAWAAAAAATAASPDGPKPPPLAHARNSPRTPANITSDASDALMRQSYYVPLHSGRDRGPGNGGSGSGNVRARNDTSGGNMTSFVPLSSPPSDGAGQPAFGGARLRAASMSAGDLPALAGAASSSGGEAGGLLPGGAGAAAAADHVRPVRDSVMGVLSGTAEPSSPVTPASVASSGNASCAGVSAGRTSLTRTRSSSEAPVRRVRAAHGDLLAMMDRPLAHAVGDRGATGVDLDDCYVGADGVFYPKTSSLVMHQHDWRLVTAAKVMALLHAANMLLPSRSRLPVEAFYNEGVDNMDLISDYDAWQARVANAFAFCQYPFLLSLRAKVQIMQVDAARQMDSKLKEAVISALFQSYQRPGASASQPHLKLFIRRRCLVEDSLHQLATHEQDLKKRLRIEFVGEDGVDAGGLTKEWFMLLVRELMNPLYGVFVREPGGNAMFWFNPASLETSNQYFLVGVVVGLALYNSTVLDLQLPLAVFKKLLRASFYQYPVGTAAAGGVTAPNAVVASAASSAATASAAAGSEGRSPVYGLLSASAQLRYQINEMLADVGQFRPDLARGLRQLLQYREGDVEEVFCLTFEATYDAYGEIVTVPLIPNGAQVAVTSQNRVEYVMRYLQWVLNDSVARQFEPFRRGFYYVCGGNALSLFKAEEIELMVHGAGGDWAAEDLKKITECVGFEAEDQGLVRWVWEVVDEMEARERRLLLAFVTGADRLPMALGSKMHVKLVLLGGEAGRLPVAHTCFNQLGIWRYRSKEELRGKLMLAIRESEGFALK
ncbi:putative E3 ubiquitin-protein ligase [Coemansia erecta]|uniref:HECT-type E3 ubiquitin transferase n=1 Tax=Coemansia erecta TaxID=147472 RepID=A0A9W7XXN9_9FUNG|nr:putative E3 ubiquitin-protein ligase [Coemansia erecta]